MIKWITFLYISFLLFIICPISDIFISKDIHMDIDNETFEEVFEDSHLTEEFLKRLGEYLEKNRGSEEARTMGRWLKEGRPLSGFTCRGDVLPDLIENFYARRIPFVIIRNENGEFGLLIRAGDEENAQQTIEDTLKAKAKYIKLVSAKDLNAALLASATSDKTILYIDGLSQEEAADLIENMNGPYGGLNAGIEKKQNGKISLLFHAKSVMKRNSTVKPITQYALQSTIAMNGEDALSNYKKTNARLKAAKEIREDFKNAGDLFMNPVYIIGTRGEYVKVTDSQIETGMVNGKDGFAPRKREDRSQEALKRIVSGIDIYGVSQNPEEIGQITSEIDTAAEHRINTGEKILAAQIDMIVEEKMQTMMITKEEGRWSGKFQTYAKEASNVLEGLAQGKVPEGYPKEAMDSLFQICTDFSLHPSEYSYAAEKMKNIATYEDKAKIEIRNISRPREPELSRFSPVRENVDREEIR